MIDVRNDVLNATRGKQRPFESASELSALQPNAFNSGTTSSVIAVEPAQGNNPASINTAASGSSPPVNTTPKAKAPTRWRPEAAKTTQAPLPEGATRQELAQDMLTELTKLGC
jgi:hypothetical protein